MRNRHWSSMVNAGILALALSAMGLALVGCSNEAPVAPFDQELDGLRAIAYVEEHYNGTPLPGQILDPDAAPRYGSLQPGIGEIFDNARQALSAEAIGEKGGKIILDLEPETGELVFPSGTLDQRVYLRAKATIYATPYGPVRMHEFSPDGVELSPSATLYLSTNLPANTRMHLYLYNSETGKWQAEQAGTADSHGVVTFRVSRLVKFAIS